MAFDTGSKPRFSPHELGIRCDARYRTAGEDRIIEMLLVAGWAYEIYAGGRDAAIGAAQAALERWIGLGLPFERSPAGERRFDPAEVLNFFKSARIRRLDPFWAEHFVPNSRRQVLEFHPGPGLAENPARFSVTLQRQYNLQGRPPGENVRLRLPLPLEDEALTDLRVDVLPPRDVQAAFTTTPGRLDACFAVPSHPLVMLGARLEFVSRPILPRTDAAPLAATERELYLRPREYLVNVSPRVASLAAELAGSLRDPMQVVRAFWDFILDGFTCGMVHYDELPAHPAEWVLDTGWYDCRLGSALLASLCRAKGLPARVNSGYVPCAAVPFLHFWSEIWIEDRGWFPLDLSCWDLSAAGVDLDWREYFFGYLNYRVKTESFPRHFTGTPSVRFTSAWYVLQRLTRSGGEIGFYDVDTGATIYRDDLSCSWKELPEDNGDTRRKARSREE